MTTRYDAIMVHEYTDRAGDKKTQFTRIGVAFPTRSGDGFMVYLRALPAPEDGQYKLLLKPPMQRDDAPRPSAPTAESTGEVIDDDIPF